MGVRYRGINKGSILRSLMLSCRGRYSDVTSCRPTTTECVITWSTERSLVQCGCPYSPRPQRLHKARCQRASLESSSVKEVLRLEVQKSTGRLHSSSVHSLYRVQCLYQVFWQAVSVAVQTRLYFRVSSDHQIFIFEPDLKLLLIF